MPIVAITPCKKPLDYEAAVRRAGATPRPVALDESPADVLHGVDGLLLTGGDDVDPALYGESPHPAFDVAEPGRDAFEIDLVRRALDSNLPVLAICRGLQVLNVALGGTLIQDIPSEPGGRLPHDADGPPTTLAHTVTVTPGSCLAAPRVVYVSCDVATLARDSRALVDAGYGLTGLTAVDLFPATAHIETVAVFDREVG